MKPVEASTSLWIIMEIKRYPYNLELTFLKGEKNMQPYNFVSFADSLYCRNLFLQKQAFCLDKTLGRNIQLLLWLKF